MIFAENFLNFLKRKDINFFTGVPDSVLKSFTFPLEKYNKSKHIISTNEGSAVATAIGYHLSKKKIAAVYLQNSGLGNAINPLISIASKEVYSIPMLLIIGWRGAPGLKDEPQHKAKGKITSKLLKRPIYKQALKSYESIVRSLEGIPIVKKKNESKLTIDFINGSSIRFMSAESDDNLRGNTFHYLICDEFAFIKKSTWEYVLRATVLVKGKKCLLISTPKGKNHFFDLWQYG